MLTAFTSAVAVWFLLGVSSMRPEDIKVDICSKDEVRSKVTAGNRLFIASPNRPNPVANSNLHCSCRVAVMPSAAATAAAASDNSSSKEDNATLSDHAADFNISIRATVLDFNEWKHDTERCWASLTMTSSLPPYSSSPYASSPNGTGDPLVFCPPLNLIDEELATYPFLNTSESNVEIVFRREELPVDDPVATFIIYIQTNSKVDLFASCSQKTTQSTGTSSARTWPPGFTVKPRTRLPSSRGPGVSSTSHGGMPITGDGGTVTTSESITISEHDAASGPISTNWSITDDSDGLSSIGAVTDDERNMTTSGFSSRTSEQTTTNQAGSKSGNDESLEYYKVKVIAISVGVASVVFVLLIVFMGYELIIHRRRDIRRNETSNNNDSLSPHRPDALVCLPYTDPDVDGQWWPSASRGCTSPSAASWPGTEFVGTTSAQRLPDSAFISPLTMPRSCANRPPIPIPVLQVETNGGGKRSSNVKGITSSTFYDVIDLPAPSPSQTQRISAYNESEPDLAASAAVAALSDSGRILTGDYGDYEFPDSINPTYTDMGQGRRGGGGVGGKDKQPAFVLPLTPCYLQSTEDGDSDGHLATNRSNASVEDDIDQQQQQQQQQPESPYDEPLAAATFDNTAAPTNNESNHHGNRADSSTNSSSSSSSSPSSPASSVLSPDCDHYDRLPAFRNRVN